MKEKNFDKKIREELESFSFNDEKADWADFELKLEMAELEADLSFDSMVSEHLGGLKMNQSADWPAMEAQMKIERLRRYQVYKLKAAELFIFFLLIFTFFQIYPGQLQKQKQAFGPFIAFEQTNTNAEKTQNFKNSESTNPISEIQIGKEEKQLTFSENQTTQLNRSARPIENEINKLPALKPTKAEVHFVEDCLREIENSSLNTAGVNPLIASITSVQIPSIEAEINYASEPNVSFSKMKFDKNLFGKSIWINVYAGMDLDVITTPYDEVYGLNAYTQFSNSNKFGTSISFYQELLEWETGLNYSRKQFQPKLLVKEISGRSSGEYAETSLQNIAFSMVQIPLQIKYHFLTFKGWRSYAMAGTSLNIVANAKYDVRLKILSDTPNYVGPTPVPEPKINDKEFSNGILSNGSFYSNSYFTLNTGFGLQKGITGNTAVFIEHSYQHHLFSGGIGPNVNKINNFTLVTGIKTNIY